MTKGFVRLAACAASGAAFLALTGCGGGTPDSSYNTPPSADRDRVDRGTELMGAAPPARRRGDSSGLLGGPVDVDGRMDPIPNPADLTRAERVRYYGHKYDHLPEPRGRAVGQGLVTRQRGDGTLEVSMRPIANPEDMSAAERRRVYGYRYAPRAETRPAARQSVRTAPPAVAAKPVAAPAARAAPAPAAAKPAPKPVVAAPPVQTAKPAAPLVAAKPAPQPAQPLAKAPSPDLAAQSAAVAAAPLAETIVENPAAETKGEGFKLPPLSLKALAIPGMPTVDVPGVGKVASEKVVGAVIALLALLLVIALARGASAGRAREERRRKFRTMQDYGRVDPDPEPAAPAAPEPVYVNPMVAASGGVAAGAVAAHAFHQEPAAETPAPVEYAAPLPEPAHVPEPFAHTPYDPHAAHETAAPEVSHDVPHAEPAAPVETAHVETAHVETPHVEAPVEAAHVETAHHDDGDVPHVPAQPDPHHHREPEHA